MTPSSTGTPTIDRRVGSGNGHALLVGRTGTGKSTLLRRLCDEDLRAGRGLLVVDPHGDLAADVVDAVPRRRRNDLVLFDATNPDECPGLNPLRAVAAERRAVVASGVIATMRKLWPEFWGPRLEHVLRHALLALTEVRGATLDDARRMLVDDAHRVWIVKQITDENVRWFWTTEFAGYGRQLTAEATAPVLNKLGAILASPTVRAIVTKQRRVLDARRALARGMVVIASLPKGQIGEDASLLLGGLLLGAFQEATMARAAIPMPERRPFQIVVDEVSSFATRPFVEMMAETRKFGVGLALATQSLAAMDEAVRAALLGNAGTLVAFQVGGEDAEILERELVDYGPRTLTRMGIGEMVVRTGAGAPSHVLAA